MDRGLKSAGDAPVSAATGLTGAVPRAVALRDGSALVESIIDAYLAEYRGRDGSRFQRLRFWRGRLGHLSLTELDDDHVFAGMAALATQRGAYWAGTDVHGQAIMKGKRGTLAAATQNRYLSALGAVLTWAQRKRVTPKGWTNPCRAIELKPENNKRVRFLTDSERTALLTAARTSKWDRLYLFVLLAATCGGRRGEIEGLRWADIDLERGEAAVALTKNGQPRQLVLVPAVVEELRKHKGAPTSLVFASKRRPGQCFNASPCWALALEAAGIKGFRFHDLRHDAASSMARAGCSLLEIGDVLGHTNTQTTQRYAHLCTSSRKALVQRVMVGVK
jgi:integrase